VGTLDYRPSSSDGLQIGILDTVPNTSFSNGTISEIGDQLGDVYRLLIQFSRLTIDIPKSATIDDATIYLTITTSGTTTARDLRVFRLKLGWILGEGCWNSRATGVPWNTAGAFGAADCEQSDIGAVGVPATVTAGDIISIGLTPSEIEEITSGIWTDNGFLIKFDTESGDLRLFGGCSNATVGNRPRLVVNFTYNGRTFQSTFFG